MALGGPADQATPRAANQPNPFESAPGSSPAPTLAKATSALSLHGPGSPAGHANGVRTPTTVGFGPITPGASQPTTGVTIGDTLDGVGGLGFGLHEPPKMLKALKGSGARTPHTDGASTPVEGDVIQGSIRGTLNVKLISARNLNVSSASEADPQPYVVMQFEQNEFVSRTPHPVSNPAQVAFTQSQPQPMSGRTASGSLGSITRAFSDAIGRKKGETSGARTPKTEESTWLGRPGPGDPIWKEEVTL